MLHYDVTPIRRPRSRAAFAAVLCGAVVLANGASVGAVSKARRALCFRGVGIGNAKGSIGSIQTASASIHF